MCTASGDVGLSHDAPVSSLLGPPAKPDVHRFVRIQEEDGCVGREGEREREREGGWGVKTIIR